MSVIVSHSWLRNPLLPSLPVRLALTAQRLADSGVHVADAHVMGGSTPAVRDVGGASLRVRLDHPLHEGGYLLAIRSHPSSSWLPAVAGVPGTRYGCADEPGTRVGLAELMVMARPVERRPQEVMFLPSGALEAGFPAEAEVQVAVLHRVTGFFLGLNGGRWLTIRMHEIAKGSQAYLEHHTQTTAQGSIEELLRGSGFESGSDVEAPPEDSAYLFEHYGMSNNSKLPL